MRDLKWGRGAGLSGLTSDIFKDGDPLLAVRLTEISHKIWELDVVLFGWFRSLIVPVYKKGRKSSCGKDRGMLSDVLLELYSLTLRWRSTPSIARFCSSGSQWKEYQIGTLTLYRLSSIIGRIRVYGENSSEFVTSSGVRHGCQLPPILFKFAFSNYTFIVWLFTDWSTRKFTCWIKAHRCYSSVWWNLWQIAESSNHLRQ